MSGEAKAGRGRRASRRDRAREPGFAHAFRVLIDGAEIAVARVEGLALAADAARLERAEGGRGGTGWTEPPPLPVRVTLARALDGDRRLYAWRREAAERGPAAARRVDIHQLDPGSGRPMNVWTLQGWPLAWTGPTFDAMDPAIAWEALTIVADDLIWREEERDGD